MQWPDWTVLGPAVREREKQPTGRKRVCLQSELILDSQLITGGDHIDWWGSQIPQVVAAPANSEELCGSRDSAWPIAGEQLGSCEFYEQ